MINAVHKFCKTRKRLANRRKLNLVRPYSSLSSDNFAFGIDYGNLLTKVSVYNYKIGKPQIVRNKIDQCDFLHSTVALDPDTNQLVTGKRAKEIKRKLPKYSVSFNKTALGSRLKDLQNSEWLNNNTFSRVREKTTGHGKSTIAFPLGENYNVEYTPVDIAAETFKTAKQMMIDFLEENQGNTEQVNAYITIPSSYSQIQREAIIEAASIAGINVVKLIEEPIAALHNTRRIENYGYYSIIDAGSSLRHWLIQVLDGRYELLEKSNLDIPDMIKETENAFIEYLRKKSSSLTSLPKKVHMDELYKLFDISKDHLMEHHDYILPKDHKFSSKIPYISREARQLSTFLAIRNYPLEKKLKSAIEISIPLESVTHPVVIGGNSLSYPEIATKFENFWQTRLSDTVTNPTHGLSVGAAIRAAVDLGQTVSILNGEIDYYGYNYSTNPTKDSIQHHLHMKQNGYSLPFLTALTFSNIASFTPVDPLLPAFNEKHLEFEEILKPHPAVSFTVQPDPLNGEPEYWARISIQVPKPPPIKTTDDERNIRKSYPYYRLYSISDPLPSWLIREMIAEQEPDISDVQPDLNLCFVLNLNCEPLHDTSRDIPKDAQNLDDIFNENEEHGEMYKKHSIKHQNNLPDYAKEKASESFTNLLKMIQHKKDTKSGHYRILNRTHDIIQFIISNLNDDDRVSLISLGSKGAETKVGLIPLDYLDKSKFLDAIINSDTIGRASERFSDAIAAARNFLVSEMEKEVDLFSILKEHEQRVVEEAKMIKSDEFFKKTGKMPISLPSSDPSLWHYPLISKEVYSIWWSLLEKERSDAKVKDKTYEEPYTVIDDESESSEQKKEPPLEPPEPKPQISSTLTDVALLPKYKFIEGIISRMESRKLKKRILGKQFRIVMITDGQPDPDKLKEIENEIQKASRDNISLTVLSIDGPQFEGEFLRILSRSKGARSLRLYKQYLWTTEFRNEWNNTNKIYQYLNDPMIKNLTCKVEFENYTVEKVYGGYMTNEEKARLDKLKSSSTLRFKIGSLYPSYEIIPEPIDPVPDENAFLVKLKPKDIDRQSMPLWDYDPNKESESDSNLPDVELAEMPSLNSKVTWDIQWLDHLNEKKNIQKVLRLTDFNPTMYYADEPGIVQLVRIANFVESMRKILHYNYQINITNGSIPSYPLLTKETGLVRLTQTEENELLNKYLQEFREISHVAKKIIRERIPLIHPEYKDLFNYITKKYIIDSFNNGNFDYNNDLIFNLLKKYAEISGLKAPNIAKNIIEGYIFRKKYYNPSLEEKIKSEPVPLWYDQFKEKNLSDPYLEKSKAIIVANELDNLNIYPDDYINSVDPDVVHYHHVGFFNITKVFPPIVDLDSIPQDHSGKDLLKKSYGDDWKILESYYDDLHRLYKFNIGPKSDETKLIADAFEEYVELNYVIDEMERKLGGSGVAKVLSDYFKAYKYPKMEPKRRRKFEKIFKRLEKLENKEKTPSKEEILNIIDELHQYSQSKDKKSRRNPIEQIFYESFLEKHKDEDTDSIERIERYNLELDTFNQRKKERFNPNEPYRLDGKFIEIDWDKKYEILKEDAKKITRTTFLHLLEKDREFRRELRKELTDLAQRAVDTQIYAELLKRKRYADRLRRTYTSDVEVMLDIEDEIYHQKLKMDPSIYALSVWMTYRRLQNYYDPPNIFFKFSNDPDINASIVERITKIMKDRGLISDEVYDVFSNRDLWDDEDEGDDFFDIDFEYHGKIRSTERFFKDLKMFEEELGGIEYEESESKMIVSSDETEEKGEHVPEESEEGKETGGEITEEKEEGEEKGEITEEKGEGEEYEESEETKDQAIEDKYDVDDFDSEWDYFVYLKQRSDKLKGEEKEERLPMLHYFYDSKAKKFDWKKLIEFDMERVRVPQSGKIKVYQNDLKITDNFGEIDTEELSQIEIESETGGRERSSENVSKYEKFKDKWESRKKTFESLKEERDYSLRSIQNRYNDDALLFYIRHRLHMNEPRIKSRYESMLEVWRHAKTVSTSMHVTDDDLRSSDFIRETERFDRSVIDGTYPLMSVMRWRPKFPVIPGFATLWKPIENLLFYKLYIPVPGLWPVEMPRTYKRDLPFIDNQMYDFPYEPDFSSPFIKYPLNEPILLTTDEIKRLPKLKDMISEHDVANVQLLRRIQSYPIDHLYYNLNRAVEKYLHFRENEEFSSLPSDKREQVFDKAIKIVQIFSSNAHLELRYEDMNDIPQSFNDVIDNIKKRFKNAFTSLYNKPPRNITGLINDLKKALNQFFEDQKKMDDLCEYIYSYELDLYKKYVPEDFKEDEHFKLPDNLTQDKPSEPHDEENEEEKAEQSEPVDEKKDETTLEEEKGEEKKEEEKAKRVVTQEEVENLIIEKILESNPFIRDYMNNNTEELRKTIQSRLDLSKKVRQVIIDEESDFEKKYFSRRRFRDAHKPYEPTYPIIEADVNELKTEVEKQRDQEEELKKKEKKKESEEEGEENK